MTGFARTIHTAAERGKAAKSANMSDLAGMEPTHGRGTDRLRQIKKIHKRRQFNADRWINFQMGELAACGERDLI